MDKITKLKDLAELLDSRKTGGSDILLLKKLNELKDEISQIKIPELAPIEESITRLLKDIKSVSKDTQFTQDYFKGEIGTLRNAIANLQLKHGLDGQNGKDGKDGRDGRDGIDGKDAEPINTDNLALEASKLALERTKELIKAIPPIEQEIVKNGESVRDSLELLKDENRLDVKAIKGLEKHKGITQDVLDRAVSILDQRTSFLINKVNNLPTSSGGGTWGSITGTLSAQTDLQTALDAKLAVTTAASTYVPYTGATGDVNLGVHEILTSALHANSSTGVHIHNTTGGDIALFGAGGGLNSTFYDGVKLDAQTADRILSTDTNKNITALDTATYPSLTELSYVKGVTSAIQTQLGNKQASDAGLTSLAGLTYASTAFVKMTGADTFSLDTNTYLTSSDLTPYAKLDGTNQPLSGNLNISKASPEFKLTDTGSSYMRQLRIPTTNFGYQYNQVYIGAADATGGTITYVDSSGANPRSSPAYVGGYTIHTFTTSGSLVVPGSATASILAIAGGGGGGSGANGAGGGGGGGYVFRNNDYALTNTTYTVTVGNGGAGSPGTFAAGTNGQNSVFDTLTATGGGGGGGSNASTPGKNGGSGGGGGTNDTGKGTGSQGFDGGLGVSSGSGGGGGGAGAVGTAGTSRPHGGAGLSNSISGVSTGYAGGGGGGQNPNYGLGTQGGGNGGVNGGQPATNGTANTGGGGGGQRAAVTAGSGGSGIVIVKYLSGSIAPTYGEAVIWSSRDGSALGEKGIQTFGDSAGRTVLDGLTQRFNIAGTEVGNLSSTGLFLGDSTTATARLELKAGTATANTAPLKFNSGTLLTSAEAGAVEFLTDKFYGTITTGAARKEIALMDAAGTVGSVYFAGTNGRITQDNANFFWDDTNNRLGLDNTSPAYLLHLGNATRSGATYIGLQTIAGQESGIEWLSGSSPAWYFYRPVNSTDLRLYDSADRVTFKNGGNVGIGITAPSALIHGIKTTEQLRLGYDSSNYLSATIGSTGSATLALTGTAPAFIFSNAIQMPYVAKTANYTLDATNYTVDCTTNSFTITLPTAVGITGRIYTIKNSGTGTITVDGNASETIDGQLTQTLNQYDALKIMSNGANWIII